MTVKECPSPYPDATIASIRLELWIKGGTTVSRAALIALLFSFLLPVPLSAQSWARKMFKVTKHDFGAVARGAKAEFKFSFENLYKEDVHVRSVRSSCGCTIPKISKKHLKTFEKSSIVAVYNTRSFLGKKNATITVTIDKPFYAEVQLNVTGYIRGDVVFNPGVVKMGEVEQGQQVVRKVTVEYAGRSSWKIVDVRSTNRHFEVALKELERSRSRVVYQMVVKLRSTAPAGYLQDQLTLVSDDTRRKTIPLHVEGRIRPALTVSPKSLYLGNVKSGDKIQKKLVVRGKKPFKVTAIHCQNADFKFELPKKAKKLHFIPVTYIAGDKTGKFSAAIRIETDLGKTFTASLSAIGAITTAEASVSLSDDK